MSNRSVTDQELLAAVVDAYESHEQDRLGGGVPVEAVHDALDPELSRSQLEDRLKALAERNSAVERVRGVDPTSWRPRWSYRPTEVVLDDGGQ